MNRKVWAVLALAVLVLLVARTHRPPAPALPVTAAGWTAARDGGAVVETGQYAGMRLAMTRTAASASMGLDIAGDPARLPDDDEVAFHGTFDDHASFAFTGDGSDGDLQATIGAGAAADWLRHMAAGGSLVISFDDQATAPLVFPLNGAGPSLRAFAEARPEGGLYGLHGTDAVAAMLGLSVSWLLALIALFYLMPAAIAYARHSAQAGVILLLNLLLGWTVIGWWVLLFMALVSPTRPQVVGGLRRF